MKTHGFTLIETMVTVVILTVLLMAAAPNLTSWLDNVRIRNAADALQQGIQTARAEAIQRNQEVSFWLVSANSSQQLDNSCALSSAAGSWVVSLSNPSQHCADAPSNTAAPQIIKTRSIGDSGGRVTVSATQTDGSTAATRLSFNGFGRVSNTSAIGQINVTGVSSGTSYRNLRITISAAGQVRLCDPNVSSTTDPRKC